MAGIPNFRRLGTGRGTPALSPNWWFRLIIQEEVSFDYPEILQFTLRDAASCDVTVACREDLSAGMRLEVGGTAPEGGTVCFSRVRPNPPLHTFIYFHQLVARAAITNVSSAYSGLQATLNPS